MRSVLQNALAGEPPVTVRLAEYALWLGFVLTPAIALVKLAALGTLGWATATLLDEPLSWLTMLSALLYAEVIVIVGGAIDAIVLLLRGIDGPQGLAAHIGFVRIPRVHSLTGAAVTNHLGVTFLVWALALFLLMRAIAGLRPWRVAAVVAVLFGSRLAFDLLRVLLVS